MSAARTRGRRHWRSLGMVGVAQLVERRLVVADVAGSSPVTHPKGEALVPTGRGPFCFQSMRLAGRGPAALTWV